MLRDRLFFAARMAWAAYTARRWAVAIDAAILVAILAWAVA